MDPQREAIPEPAGATGAVHLTGRRPELAAARVTSIPRTASTCSSRSTLAGMPVGGSYISRSQSLSTRHARTSSGGRLVGSATTSTCRCATGATGSCPATPAAASATSPRRSTPSARRCRTAGSSRTSCGTSSTTRSGCRTAAPTSHSVSAAAAWRGPGRRTSCRGAGVSIALHGYTDSVGGARKGPEQRTGTLCGGCWTVKALTGACGCD